MCRFVFVVIFVSCVSFGVLADGVKNTTCTIDDPQLSIKRQEWHKCFHNTVILHLHPDAPVTGDCYTATGFGEKIDSYIKLVNTKCMKNLTLDTKNLIKFIEFSLKGDSFKKFYDDLDCVKNHELNISKCVKDEVTFFNITKEKKHTSWATKANLKYTEESCSISKTVRNCVQATLHNCKPYTEEYMEKLFNYARELGNCSQFPDTTAIPPPGGISAAPAPWLTIPVIITLSIGALVVVVAIIIIVVLKCKN